MVFVCFCSENGGYALLYPPYNSEMSVPARSFGGAAKLYPPYETLVQWIRGINGWRIAYFNGSVILKWIVVDDIKPNTSTHQSVNSPDPLY